MRLTVLGFAVILLAVGCGADGAGRGDGGGGGVGGGADGGAGTGAAGSGGGGFYAALPPVPACLAQLAAPCPLSGTCTFSFDGTGIANDYCWGSGTKTKHQSISTCGGSEPDSTGILTVRRSDGSICYTLETSCVCSHACESGMTIWKDPTGQVIATARVSSGGASSSKDITCAGTGEKTTLLCGGAAMPPSPPDCNNWPQGIASPLMAPRDCSEGSCP